VTTYFYCRIQPEGLFYDAERELLAIAKFFLVDRTYLMYLQVVPTEQCTVLCLVWLFFTLCLMVYSDGWRPPYLPVCRRSSFNWTEWTPEQGHALSMLTAGKISLSVAVGFVDFLLSSSIAWCSLEVRRSVQQQTALFTAVRPPARAPGNPKESHNKITFGENILYSYTQIAGCLWRNQMASSWISLTNLKHMRYD